MVSRIRRLLAISLLSAISLGTSYAQLPTVATGARNAAATAQGLELVQQIGGSVNAIAANAGTLYLGVGPRVRIVDVSVPSRLTIKGETPPLAGVVTDLTIVGTIAYVALGWAGMVVLDVADPSRPAVIYSTARATRRIVAGSRYLYTGPGIHVYDLLNPRSPVYAGRHDGPELAFPLADRASGDIITPPRPYRMAIADGVLLVASNDVLHALDLANPARPKHLGAYAGGTYNIVASRSLALVGDFGQELQHVVDVSTPNAPRQVADIPGIDGAATAIIGTLAYTAVHEVDDGPGVILTDLADSTNPRRIGSFVTIELPTQIAVEGSVAYMIAGDLSVLDLSDPTHPREMGRLAVGSRAVKTIGIDGSRLFTESESAGTDGYPVGEVVMLDVTDLERPRVVASADLNRALQSQGAVRAREELGGFSPATGGMLRALMPRGRDTYVTVSLRQPRRQTMLLNFDNDRGLNSRRSIAIAGAGVTGIASSATYAYVTAADQLIVLDLSTSDTDPVTSRTYVGHNQSGLALGDQRLYTVDDLTLHVIDISDPLSPTVLGTYPTDGVPDDIAFADGNIFLAVYDGRLLRLDVLREVEPGQIERVGTVNVGTRSGLASTRNSLASHARGSLTADARYVYMAVEGQQIGVHVFDVSDPRSPRRVGLLRTPSGAPLAVAGNGSHVYVADGDGGIAVLRLSAPR